MNVTRGQLGFALGEAMRTFGYSDFTDAAALEVFDAYAGGKRDEDLPHGVVGMMLEGQIKDLIEARPTVLRLARAADGDAGG